MMLNNIEKKLAAHLGREPKLPKRKTMILCDATPEAMAWHLHDVHHSAGLFSSEGGQILDGRAADKLPMLNTLWDGGDLVINRKESASFTVRNGRLTINVMVQRKTFGEFLKRRGDCARDNGFLARALICDPPSTQGTRMIRTIEEATFPKLEIFKKRLTELLEQSQTALKSDALKFSPDAKVLWVDFANHIENHLNLGGMYFEVRDAASKTAENVARMAALFHVSEGRKGDIQQDSVNQALKICEWYLQEFKRIFVPPPPIPQQELDAQTLDTWLRQRYMKFGQHSIRRNEILQMGPNSLRIKARLGQAIDILQQFGKINTIQHWPTKTWWVELFVNSTPYYPTSMSILIQAPKPYAISPIFLPVPTLF